MLVTTVAEKMISTLAGRGESPQVAHRRLFMGMAVILSGTGATAMAMLSVWALPLLLANVGVMAVWMVRTRRDAAPRDIGQRRARARTDAGAILASTMALLASIGWSNDMLGPVDDHLSNAVIASTAAGLTAWISSGLNWWPWTASGIGFVEEEEQTATLPLRCEIAPAFGRWPLRDPDTGLRFSHFAWLEEDIANRIEHWDDLFQEAFAPERPGDRPVFATAEAEALYLRECDALTDELETVFGPGNVDVSPGVFWRQAGGQ